LTEVIICTFDYEYRIPEMLDDWSQQSGAPCQTRDAFAYE
jgi:hypothetical protein